MKNQFFSLFAIVILAMATSCQKEYLEPAIADLTTDQTLVKAKPNNGQTNAAITWSTWNLCGDDYYVGMEGPDDYPTMHLLGNDFLPSMDLHHVLQFNLLPPAVKTALYNIDPNAPPMALWQSFDPGNSMFIAEYLEQTGMVKVFVLDMGGNGICKGFHF